MLKLSLGFTWYLLIASIKSLILEPYVDVLRLVIMALEITNTATIFFTLSLFLTQRAEQHPSLAKRIVCIFDNFCINLKIKRDLPSKLKFDCNSSLPSAGTKGSHEKRARRRSKSFLNASDCRINWNTGITKGREKSIEIQ